ncbi:hypothetical protein NWI01_23680 [Nitrobacter winogradskyi]|uniref:Uncharacterized protein n=1 Tax=Nitrobacter winogradskyi TaxID=913 RepID=A0A4Y3WGS4_NITWI|nr:hypothetical protein NWI01_23680 [Nitrobacter winogradskyi]
MTEVSVKVLALDSDAPRLKIILESGQNIHALNAYPDFPLYPYSARLEQIDYVIA